jgi:hypothetical protein
VSSSGRSSQDPAEAGYTAAITSYRDFEKADTRSRGSGKDKKGEGKRMSGMYRCG